jgi:hypothetical protein
MARENTPAGYRPFPIDGWRCSSTAPDASYQSTNRGNVAQRVRRPEPGDREIQNADVGSSVIAIAKSRVS